MSRTLRAQYPGMAFHITARTQGHAHWFVERLRTPIERIIIEGVTSSDAWLISHVVMSNHFHIIIRQGAWPLGRIMQPIIRRMALLVQRAHDFEGHVFERRFRSLACENADQLRNWIVYTHNNPRRKHMCDDLSAYPWSSHFRYVTEEDGQVSGIELVSALRLFADTPPRSRGELRANYMRFVEWRLAKDDADALGIPFGKAEPPTADGDKFYTEKFAALPLSPRRIGIDLRDKALQLLDEIDGDIDMARLRRRTLTRPLVEVRRQLVAALFRWRRPAAARYCAATPPRRPSASHCSPRC